MFNPDNECLWCHCLDAVSNALHARPEAPAVQPVAA